MIDKNKAITFNAFFLLEFMKIVLNKAQKHFDQKATELLRRFDQSFRQVDDPILALEKLARFQETSEMSIFLFDMLDRLEKISPQQAVENLDELSNDFINLYALMVEDPEIMASLQRVVDELQPAGEAVEKAEEERLPFADFYRKYLEEQLQKQLGEAGWNTLKSLLPVFMSNRDKLDQIHSAFARLGVIVNELWPENLEDLPPTQLLENSDDKISQLVNEFNMLQSQYAELVQQAVEQQTLPEAEEEQPALAPAEQEKSEVTIDQILKEYFHSEVSDHIQLIKKILDEKFSRQNLLNVIKNFRSLKEISMIHGYGGVEYLCDRIIQFFREHEDDILSWNESFVQAFEALFETLTDVETFEHQLEPAGQKEKVQNLIDGFEAALQKKEEPAKEAEPVEKAPEPKEPLLSLDDREQMFEIYRDLLKKVEQKFNPFAVEVDFRPFLAALESLETSAEWLDERVKKVCLQPMKDFYQQVKQNAQIDQHQALQKLREIWQGFVDEVLPESDFKQTIQRLKSFDLKAFAIEQTFDVKDTQTLKAFAQSMRAGWNALSAELAKAFSEKDAATRVVDFLKTLQKNLSLLGLQAYNALPELLLKHLEGQPGPIEEDLVNEIKQTFGLYFDRLESKGAMGNGDDLAEALSELLPAEKAAVEQASDDQDFIEDSQSHIEAALQALQALREKPEQRGPFKQIAGEIHAVYSGAQFMNRQRVADAAIIIEETAEMFAEPSVNMPEILPDRMQAALEALGRLIVDPNAEIEKPFEDLQKILDQLVLEEPAVSEEVPGQVAEKDKKEVEEKPLFSPDVSDEEELRDIFKEDAQNLLHTIKQANTALLKDPMNERMIHELDQGLHALRNAAKMTGLDDLAIIFGRFEEITQILREKPHGNTIEVQQQIGDLITELEPLILKADLQVNDLDAILSKLDALAAQVAEMEKDEDRRKGQLRELFVEEARELIDKINHVLLELEKVPESSTVLADLLRHLHTLKGGAMMANYTKIGEIVHKLEDYFQLYRGQNAETKLELLPTAFTMIDLISEMVRAVEAGKPETVSKFTARLADIDNKLFFLKDFEIPRELLDQQTVKSTGSAEPPVVQEADNTLKVKASYLDHLVNLATELVISRTELTSHFETLKNLVQDFDNQKKNLRTFAHQIEDFVEERSFVDFKRDDQQKENDFEILRELTENVKTIASDFVSTSGSIGKLMRFLEKNISQLSVLSKSLHADLLKARMIPVRVLFERFERPVRDLAREQKKQIEFVIEDNGAEMDRALVEALYEPLLHILRNAVDHGIEKATERKKAGKERKGKIILRARQEKSQVVIDVIDDGKGIDLEKIRKQIVKLKLATKKEAEKMSEGRLIEFIFRPEFSTRDKTTKVSGRGIGLDIVAAEIQKLKGIVRVKTTPGEGTVFSIRVPLTLIVSHAMLIKWHEQTVAIPLLAIMESVKLNPQDILVDDQRKYIQVRGKLLPYVDIDDMLKIADEESAPTPKETALILHDSGVSVALGIEEIIGRQDIIIKNLGNLLQNVELISGGTILANGEVALILDYAALIHQVEADFFGESRERQLIRKLMPRKERKADRKPSAPTVEGIVPKKIKGRKPVVLVVDDSLSVRRFISTFLEKNGYHTIDAEDGEQALKVAQEQTVDLVITDLQMPKMDGFTLIEKLRSFEQYADLPIIILTAQVSKQQQQKGEEVGANAFVSKPFKEADLIRMVNAFVQRED